MLDFKNFEKIAEDDKTVTMRHGKGHEIKVILKGLRPIEREQIKRLKMADGGKVQSFDDGTADDTIKKDDSSAPDTSASPDKSITINVGQPAQQAPLAQPAQVPAAEVQPVPSVPSVAPTQNAGNPTEAALVPARALQVGQQAGNAQQAVDTAKAQGALPIAEQQQQNAMANAQRVDNTVKDFQQHTADMAKYLTDPKNTNPSAFYENMGVPQKINTAIGLILGGFKQGLVGGNNPAMDWLKDQQEKDIAAQRQRAENQKTVWGAYNTLYGNENASTELAKKSWTDKLAADANVLAAKLGTPQAAINNQKFQADLLKSGYDNLQKAAFIANQPGAHRASPFQGGPSASIEPSGKEEKSKFGPDHADASGVYDIEPILKPGAAQIMDQEARRATGDPAASAQLARLQEQYAHASKADEVLKRAKDLYTSLHQNATPGGWIGRTAQHANLEGIPIAGPILQGVSNFAGDAYTGARKHLGLAQPGSDEFSENRQYDTARQELGDMLRNIYPGIGGGEYNAKLNAIVPDQTDKPEDITRKQRAFEDLIKTSGSLNVLKNKGLAR